MILHQLTLKLSQGRDELNRARVTLGGGLEWEEVIIVMSYVFEITT